MRGGSGQRLLVALWVMPLPVDVAGVGEPVREGGVQREREDGDEQQGVTPRVEPGREAAGDDRDEDADQGDRDARGLPPRGPGPQEHRRRRQHRHGDRRDDQRALRRRRAHDAVRLGRVVDQRLQQREHQQGLHHGATRCRCPAY